MAASNSSTTATVLQLGYGLSPRRRKRVRIAVLLAMLILAGLAAWRWGAEGSDRATRLYWQRRCLTYSPPADQVVYEENPTAADQLIQRDFECHNYSLKRAWNPNAPRWNAAARLPRCWVRYLSTISLRSWSTGIHSDLPPIAFLHERTSPAGHRRLVIVTYMPGYDEFSPEFLKGRNYFATVLTPATWTRPPAETFNPWIDLPRGWPRTPPNVRMYAGQIDPADPSHFTIRYEMWGQSDVLDGRLDDADNVTLTPRNPPREPRP